jgi:hypothetical protein
MKEEQWHKRAKLFVPMIVSIAVLAAALYVILSKQYDDSYTKWAFGVIGVVIGYWLR